MNFYLHIDCVDGTYEKVISDNYKGICTGLAKHDHEGASLSLQIETDSSEDVYTILESLRTAEMHEAVAREQREVNNDLAFRLGGVKAELLIAHRLLRRLREHVGCSTACLVVEDIDRYLAGGPKAGVES